MKLTPARFTALWLLLLSALHAAEIKLSSPLEHQVIQRTSHDKGMVRIVGTGADSTSTDTVIEARMIVAGRDAVWQKLSATFTATTFEIALEAPAGGWHRLEVRASREC